MGVAWKRSGLVVGWLLAALGLASGVSAAEGWDRAAAIRYLDGRAAVWTTRSRERQKLTTACISCHTALPYLLARGALGDLSEAEPARELFSDVETRVGHWDEVRVWYEANRGADKPEQSRGTESVMNALVLTLRDRRAGTPLSESAKSAVARMWSLQNETGSWSWLHFGLGPWETDGSDFWGASLAAVAGMSAGEELAPPESLSRLRRYLREGLARELSAHNRLALLWAASVWPTLLSHEEQDRLVDGVLRLEQPDGGFRLVDLGPWPSKDGTPPAEKSDGYATAFATFVLEELRDPRCREAVGRGIAWLQSHQETDGRWATASPNKDRSEEEAFTRLLASDAATGFAVLALTFADSSEASRSASR